MTVKELKEALNKFPDSCIVCAWFPDGTYTEITNAAQGCNEWDGIVVLDNCEQDDD